MIANLHQLNREIKLWVTDGDTKQIIQPWVREHVKTLYIISVISGSSFSAVEICDSNLFQLKAFSMNLPLRQKQHFKNQRVLSIVLLENIPQFILQLIYMIFLIRDKDVSSQSGIVIIAMVFSILSIVVTLFEFRIKKFVFDSEYLMIIKFKLESIAIQSMSKNQFDQTFVNKRKVISSELSKILEVNYDEIEQLKPTWCKQGAQIVCHVRSDAQFINPRKAMDELETAIKSGRLPRQIKRGYGMTSRLDIIDVQVSQLGPENKGQNAVETIAIRSTGKEKGSANATGNENGNGSGKEDVNANKNGKVIVTSRSPTLNGMMIDREGMDDRHREGQVDNINGNNYHSKDTQNRAGLKSLQLANAEMEMMQMQLDNAPNLNVNNMRKTRGGSRAGENVHVDDDGKPIGENSRIKTMYTETVTYTADGHGATGTGGNHGHTNYSNNNNNNKASRSIDSHLYLPRLDTSGLDLNEGDHYGENVKPGADNNNDNDNDDADDESKKDVLDDFVSAITMTPQLDAGQMGEKSTPLFIEPMVTNQNSASVALVAASNSNSSQMQSESNGNISVSGVMDKYGVLFDKSNKNDNTGGNSSENNDKGKENGDVS